MAPARGSPGTPNPLWAGPWVHADARADEPHYGRRGRTQVDWPADVTDAESLKCGSWRQRKSASRSRSGSVQEILTVKRYASAFAQKEEEERRAREKNEILPFSPRVMSAGGSA